MELVYEERQGRIHINNNGSEMKIVHYKNSRDIDVLVTTKHPDGKTYRYLAKNKTYKSFTDGHIKSPYDFSIRNLGYIGEGIYNASINSRPTKVYNIYIAMINRSLAPISKAYVCKEWRNFQTFASWYEDSSYYTKDDDLILYRLNPYKRVYSPDNYILIPSSIARFIQSYLNTKHKRANIYNYKLFNSKKEADINFSLSKYNIILNHIMKYKEILPEDIYHKLIINIRV